MKKSKLWKEVDKILWEEWDPIGVNDSGPNDEYSSYVPSIVKLFNEGADEHKISKCLQHHASVNMGLSNSIFEHHQKIAKKLCALK